MTSTITDDTKGYGKAPTIWAIDHWAYCRVESRCIASGIMMCHV